MNADTGIFGVLVVLALIFVNGATDAPNCIAGAVASGSLTYISATSVCAVFNFAGMMLSSLFFPAVAESVSSLVDFGGAGVTASLLSVIIFSGIAWLFGIPTSESHGLIASLGGASLYFTGTLGGGFAQVTVKSVISCAVGAVIGAFFYRFMSHRRPTGRRKAAGKRCGTVSAVSAAGASFCHGMQDGQKFVAVLALLAGTQGASVGTAAICSAMMALGCFCGGKRIISKLGVELAGKVENREAAASDLGALLCTAVSSFVGIPVSTTYMKTCSMLGAAGAAGRRIDRRTAAELALTWAATYPVCMGISYALCAVIEMIV